jgi:rhodanese-related sulfurtransferase
MKGAASREIILQSLALVLLSAGIAFSVNSLRPDGLALVRPGHHLADVAAAGAVPAVVSLERARTLFETGKAVFLDARPLRDYQTGHIHGAINLPWQEIDAYFDTVMPRLPVDKPIIVYCDGEACTLSRDLAQFLAEAGFSDSRVLVNGWSLWNQAGLPTAAGRDT